MTGPVPLVDGAVDEYGDLLDEEQRIEIMEKRTDAFHQYCQVRDDTQKSWKFADGLIRNTLVAYTNRKKFLDALQLPDKQRSYVVIVNRDGKMFWFEHERCTVSKANDAFDRFKLDHLKIGQSMLPRHVDIKTKLYGRVNVDVPLLSSRAGKAFRRRLEPSLKDDSETKEMLEDDENQTNDKHLEP